MSLVSKQYGNGITFPRYLQVMSERNDTYKRTLNWILCKKAPKSVPMLPANLMWRYINQAAINMSWYKTKFSMLLIWLYQHLS